MICPSCQHNNRETARFCENCGNSLHTVCPNCATANRPGSKFCDNCGHDLVGGEKSPEAASPSQSQLSRFIPSELAAKLESARASQAMEGERRIVTMLFCDVKGSTAAAEALDPEDWADVMNGAFETMIPPIYRYEGTVARLMGDAILAFFGAPIAHEDDPRRAVLAGLDIVSAVTPYREQIRQQWGFDFDVRVGINTGLVMVGAVGSDLRMEYTAMGDAINLAARMEQTAAPGTVQISQETYQHVAPYFEFEFLGGISVKGKQATVQTYRPLRRKGAPGQVRGITGLSAPLIGRARERSVLEEALADLEQGLGGIVYLVGEAGLGKSRLIQEIRDSALGRAPGAHLTWYETLSYSYETEQPYGLFRRLIRRMMDVLPEERPASLRMKVQRLAEDSSPEERPALQQVIGSLLGLAGSGGEPPLEGETFKGLLYTTMTSLWQRQAQTKPVVLVCDDLHWSDPASLALLQHLYPLVDRVPLLFLCALRPEPDAPGREALQAAEESFSHRFRRIELGPLKAGESGELVDSLLEISDLPVGLRARIMAKSEGNPFYVEEVVRSLIDQGVVVRDEDGARWLATGEGEDLEIPGNLQTLLVARMDRLQEQARWTLQAASVVGRSFLHRVLQRIVDFAVSELDQYLRALEHSQLIQEASRLPELEYLFRHALTQEAAYSTILHKQRKVYHRRVAEAIEESFPDHLEEMAGSLSDHFFRAAAFEKSMHYAIQAGDAAFRLYAIREAIEHYARAIQCTSEVDAGTEQLIHLYSRYGRSYELENQFDQAQEIYLDMTGLADDRDDDQLRLAALLSRCILHATHTTVFDPPQARELGRSALALAQTLGNREAEARALWGMMLVEFSSAGDLKKVLEYGRQALELAGELGLDEMRGYILGNLFWVHMGKSQMARAREAQAETEAIWSKLGNLPMLADTYTLKVALQWTMGQYDAGLETAAETLRLSRSIGNVWNEREALRMMGVLHTLKGHFGEALQWFKKRRVDPKDDPISYQGYANSLIELYYFAGALEEANRIADELYALRDVFMPLFAPFFLPTIARIHIARGNLQYSRKLLDQAWERYSPEAPLAVMRIAIDLMEGHLNLALENPKPVGSHMEKNIRLARKIGFHLYLTESLWLLGKAQLAIGNFDQARATFQEAKEEAEGTGERIVLWRILADWGDLERIAGDGVVAEDLTGQALREIKFIADHASPELKAIFLAQSAVRKITGDQNPQS